MMNKIQQANYNIEELVDIVIDYERSKMKLYCPYPEKQHSGECDDWNCDLCKDEYYEDKKEEMLKHYQV